MSKKKILITGGCGFIGYNFVKKCIELNIPFLVLDDLRYSSNKFASEKLKKKNLLEQIDISDKKIEKIIKNFSPNIIVNFAAESHVDRSIDNSDVFVKTNILGVHNLIEICMKNLINFKFVHISTDEVFGSLNKSSKKSKEDDKYDPSSPYSSTKAAADLLIKSWQKTYNFPSIIIHPTNNYGPWQFPEKLIPLSILKILTNKNIPIYGTGSNVREWLHVDDCVDAILSIIEKGKVGESYNIGSGEQVANIDIAKKIIKILKPQTKNCYDLIDFVDDRPAHDTRYQLNLSKTQKYIDWRAKILISTGIAKTIDWYISNFEWLRSYEHEIGIINRIGTNKIKRNI